MQTRLGSWLEAWANIFIGFGINWAMNLVILPVFGFHVTMSQSFHISLMFTAVSLARSYVLRRVFNRIKALHHYHRADSASGVTDREDGSL